MKMKKFNIRNALTFLVGVSFCSAASYIAGHAACAHQHASLEEQQKMLPTKDNGDFEYGFYIRNAFRDFKKMHDDPFGFNRWVQEDLEEEP